MRDALDETQRLLAETAEATGDVVLVAEPLADGSFRQRYVSPHAGRLLYGAELPAGTDLIPFYDSRVHPDDAVAVADRGRRGGRAACGTSRTASTAWTARSGASRSRGKVLETPSGERLLFDVATEVTARVELEARAEEAERRFATLVEQAADVFFINALAADGTLTALYRSPRWPGVVWGADAPVDPLERREALDPETRSRWASVAEQLEETGRTAAEFDLVGVDGHRGGSGSAHAPSRSRTARGSSTAPPPT